MKTFLLFPGSDSAFGVAVDAAGIVFIADSFQQRIVRLTPKKIIADIDIKPGSDPNCFNSNGLGAIPVAVLSTADFDAATEIDPTTLELDGQAVRVVGKKGNIQAHAEDVNGDGLDDLVIQIEDDDGTYEVGDTVAMLTGFTFDGIPVKGADSICIVQ